MAHRMSDPDAFGATKGPFERKRVPMAHRVSGSHGALTRVSPNGADVGRPRYAAPVSRIWSLSLHWFYRFLVLIDPLVRTWYARFGLGNTIDLVVPGRRSGRPRAVLLGLLRVDGQLYLGHPNGDVAWTRNLEAAGVGELRLHGLATLTFRPVRLPPGDEREAAIRATWRQHPFPGNLIYYLARDHIRAVGAFFRLEPATPP